MQILQAKFARMPHKCGVRFLEAFPRRNKKPRLLPRVFVWCGKRDSWTNLAALDCKFCKQNSPVCCTNAAYDFSKHFSDKKTGRRLPTCFFGAGNGTWTRTVWTTRPSNVRVCQFRHSRICCLTWQRRYYTTDHAKCQEVFWKNFKKIFGGKNEDFLCFFCLFTK